MVDSISNTPDKTPISGAPQKNLQTATSVKKLAGKVESVVSGNQAIHAIGGDNCHLESYKLATRRVTLGKNPTTMIPFKPHTQNSG